MQKRSIICLLAALWFSSTGSAQAVVMYDQNVTGSIIFGSGNDNGGFTVDRENGIELGLRAKLRFDENNQPQNVFNSNGDGTYSFNAGTPPIGFSFDPNSPTTPVWSFEWSINSNYNGSSGFALDDLLYQIRIDFDPGPGVLYQSFDPINDFPPVPDHAIGTNATANGAGTTAGGDQTVYEGLIATNNLAQNSWNMEFFNDAAPFDTFDPKVPGVYTITLLARGENEALLASVSIDVIVNEVPEPATLGLMLLGLTGLGFLAWRRSDPAMQRSVRA